MLTLDQLKHYSYAHIEKLQNLRFHATCSYLLPHTPFYKKLFLEHNVDPQTLKTPEDWQQKGLPLVKKAAYLKNPTDFIVNPDRAIIFENHFRYLLAQHDYGEASKLLFGNKEDILNYFYKPKMLVFSGGTESGQPAPVFLTAHQKFGTLYPLLKIAGELILDRYPLNKKTGMNLFPYAPHLGWHAVHAALDINADLNLNTAAGGAVPTERLVELAGKAQPTIICGMSDYLRDRFLPMAIKKKIRLPENVIFINGAQKMLDEERTQIQQLASKLGVDDAAVLDLYAASELKEAILPELIPGGGYYHLAPLSAIIKTVSIEKSTPELITEWQFSDNGAAAIWNINGAGTLFAGYLLGDAYGMVDNQPCAKTGLNVMKLYGINRLRDVRAQLAIIGTVEEKIKGTKINLMAYRQKAFSLNIIEAQIILHRKKKQVEVKYVADKNMDKQLKELYKTFEIRPKITRTTLQKLLSDKIKLETIKIQ